MTSPGLCKRACSKCKHSMAAVSPGESRLKRLRTIQSFSLSFPFFFPFLFAYIGNIGLPLSVCVRSRFPPPSQANSIPSRHCRIQNGFWRRRIWYTWGRRSVVLVGVRRRRPQQKQAARRERVVSCGFAAQFCTNRANRFQFSITRGILQSKIERSKPFSSFRPHGRYGLS